MSKGGAEVIALASHQCSPDSDRGIDVILCGFSLLLVLSFTPRGFSPVLRFSPLLKNQHWTRNQVDEEEPPSGYATSKSLFIYQ